MPIGIIIDVFSVALGGLIGSMVGNKLSEEIKQHIDFQSSIGLFYCNDFCLSAGKSHITYCNTTGSDYGCVICLSKGNRSDDQPYHDC